MSTGNANGPAGGTSKFKISEAILKTGQLDRMKSWYTRMLGVGPYFEHSPPEGSKPADFGGQTRATDLRMCFFRLSEDFPFLQTIGIFEEPGTLESPEKRNPGLHHLQLMAASLDDLCDKYEELRDAGLKPHRSANHGMMTSFYYRDPDNNVVEITVQNFATFDEMATFMASEGFRDDPSGDEIEPDTFVGWFRKGVPVDELTRLNRDKR